MVRNMLYVEVHLKATHVMYEAHHAISPKQKHGWLQIRRCQRVSGGIQIVLMSVSALYANLTAQLENNKDVLKKNICRILTEENSLGELLLQELD